MQSFMNYNIGISEFPPLFYFFYAETLKRGARGSFAPERYARYTKKQDISDAAHLFLRICASRERPDIPCLFLVCVQSVCDPQPEAMKLFHLLLLLLDHLADHLSTDRTCLTGRQISVVAVL